MNRLQALALALALAGAAAPALAQEFKAGDITVDKAWARATPKGAEVGAAYFVIHNNGATPERLTGGSADFATVEIHEMKTDSGVMKMAELKNGLNIPAHATIRLAPGGYHLMFTHLTKPLTKGETIKATLTFEHSGSVEVDFPVEAVGAASPAPTKGG
ncbi:MAG TPA: copper chaperone PCu(A)C, partial [Roseiarcus sp.]|nr:copper chaperone PCu(A)C [Roseiarcus sp.]